MSRRAVVIVLAVAAATIAADLGTKAWARAALVDGATDFGWIALRLAENPGVAFSLGANMPTWVVLTVTTGAVVLLAVMAMRGTLHPPAAAGFLLGGGVANLVDRLQDGTVTDMIDLGWFPSFNVADIALNVGVGLVLLWALLHGETEEGVPTPATGDATEPTGDATEPTGHATEPTGHATEPTGDATEPTGHATERIDDARN